MSTIQELGAFLAREAAAGSSAPPSAAPPAVPAARVPAAVDQGRQRSARRSRLAFPLPG
jgi:hypothetical protein